MYEQTVEEIRKASKVLEAMSYGIRAKLADWTFAIDEAGNILIVTYDENFNELPKSMWLWQNDLTIIWFIEQVNKMTSEEFAGIIGDLVLSKEGLKKSKARK